MPSRMVYPQCQSDLPDGGVWSQIQANGSPRPGHESMGTFGCCKPGYKQVRLFNTDTEEDLDIFCLSLVCRMS